MAPHPEWRRDGFVIASDPAATDLDLVTGFLAESYWAAGIARAEVERCIARSAVYNLLVAAERRQIGFARVVSDGVRFAWLSDVFVLPAWRGRGLATWLVTTAMNEPRHAEVRRWMLATQDAHEFYRRCGWQDVPAGRHMVLTRTSAPDGPPPSSTTEPEGSGP